MTDPRSDVVTVKELVDELEKAAHGLDVAAKLIVAMDSEIRDYESSMARANRKVARLRAALDTIGGGHYTRFPGGPSLVDMPPEEFRQAMWTWSQKVARSALDPTKIAEVKP